MKIFGTGLQRTGTMSLTKALSQLNFRANQFPKELYSDIHHSIIQEYDAFTDFPIPLLYKALDRAYPGSKFIHTIRDENSWLKSVQWLFTTGSVKFNTVENIHAQTFHEAFYGSMHFDPERFLKRFREHNEDVAAYFSDRPDDLIIINLTSENSYEKICAFLDVPVPDEPFPYTNKREGIGKVRIRKFRQKVGKRLRRQLRNSRLRPIFLMVNGIVSPLPLTSSPKRLSCTPFFILTTGRSGSTLLRAILNQHDDVCIPPESNKLGQIVRDFLQTFRYLKWQQVVSLVTAEFQKERGFSFWEVELTAFFAQAANTASKDYNLAYLIDLFYNYYLQVHKPDAVRWGDKSVKNAFNLAHISNLFPDAQYIHIYRDGRDVATSLFQEGLCPNPETGAEQWMKAITNIHDFGRTLPESRFLEISYENLVQNPEQTIQAVCEYLSLDFQPKLLDFWNNTENLGDANRSLHENLKNPINNDAIGKWKKSLDISQQTLVEMRLRGILSELGYK